MSARITPPRLVRLQDRLGYGSDDNAPWRFNPRTGAVEARAGLSWTGVRDYRTPRGIVRVLRRPEQVNSPGHLGTLRRLPAPEGHPSGNRDVLPENYDELLAGWTGDEISIEPCGGYPRPVAEVTVFRPSTMVKMVDAAAWADACERYPKLRDVHHDGGAPRSGTSLGYNALWYGPSVEAEIKGERDDGGLIGEWQGPHGPEQYDVEHIVDPKCEIVQRLARETGFNPQLLGGQHFAIALPALTGRGAEQSELMRIVDSIDLPIVGDLARAATRLSVQVPAKVEDLPMPNWTVGTSRDLPITSGEWDGDAAAASVFEWAGFDGDSPDPAKARQAFLLYDADAPERRDSYKDPIARYRDGRLEVVKEGLDAAASYLPQTDASEDAKKRARDVLDFYYAKFKESAARDAAAAASPQRTIAVKNPIDIGLTRDLATALTKRGIDIPTTLTVTLDEIDAMKVKGKVDELLGMVGELAEMLAKSDEAMGEMSDKMKDMMSPEEAQAKVDEIKTALAEAEKQLMAAKAEAEGAKKMADSLDAELAPLRADQLSRFKDEVIAAGFDAAKIKACADAAEVRRLVCAEKVGDRYTKMRDDNANEFVLGDDIVQHTFDGVWSQIDKAPSKPQPRPAPARDNGSPGLSLVPTPKLPHQPSPNDESTAAQRVADQLDAGFATLGG